MGVVKLNRDEIVQKIIMGDTCEGNWALAVAPDGSGHKIVWSQNNRQWDPYPDGWLEIGIPALDPDGSGQAGEDAIDCLRDAKMLTQARVLMEKEDIGPVDAVLRLAAEYWEVNRYEATDWLAEAFLWACNGDGHDLDTPDPWGVRYNDDNSDIESIEPPAKFEWDTESGDDVH